MTLKVKQVTHPITNKTYAFGWKPPKVKQYRLAFANYATPDLPPPPDEVDYTKKAKAALDKMYLNDQMGDCVIAGMAHVAGVLMDNAENIGVPFTLSDTRIVGLYEQIGGYDPNFPRLTDHGCSVQTALNYWQKHGLMPHDKNPHKIYGWLAVDARDKVACRHALHLFENLILGVPLPDKWVSPAPQEAGFTWDVAGDPVLENGHCFIAGGYDPKGYTISTWGMLGHLTNEAAAKYAVDPGECYTVLSEDSINKAQAKAPNGFDFETLKAHFAALHK